MTLPVHVCRHGGMGKGLTVEGVSSGSPDVSELSHTQHTGTEFGSVQGILFLKVDNLLSFIWFAGSSPSLLHLSSLAAVQYIDLGHTSTKYIQG